MSNYGPTLAVRRRRERVELVVPLRRRWNNV